MEVSKAKDGYAIHIQGFVILFTRYEIDRGVVSFFFGETYKCNLFEPDAFYKAWREMLCRDDD